MTLPADEAGHPRHPDEQRPPLRRVVLVVAYLGGGFRGFAAQPGVRTVAGALGEALGRYLRQPVELTCAGRTDAGVHARGQVVHFDTTAGPARPASARGRGRPRGGGGDSGGGDPGGEDPGGGSGGGGGPSLDLEGLQRACNRMLGPEVVVRSAMWAPEGFDARRSALARRYRYAVCNQPLPDPFTAATSWHVEAPLDLRALRLACDPLFGEHDFSSFCRRPPDPGASLVRVVREARWEPGPEGMLHFEVEASSFCQQMVRALVGTMVEVGTGKRRAGEMSGILRARDRARAGQLAPPHGLCLWAVRYPVPVGDTTGGTALAAR